MMMNEGESCHSRAAAIPDSTHSRASVNLIAPRRLPTPGPEPQEEESSVDNTNTNHQDSSISKHSQRLKEEEQEGAVVFGKPQAVQLVGGQLVPRLPKRLPTPGPTDTDDGQEDGLVPPRRMPTPGATDDAPEEQQQPYQSPVHGAVMPQFQFFSRRASFVLPERYGTPMIPEQNEDDEEEDGVDWRGNGSGPRMVVPSPLDFNNSEEFSQITEPSLMQQPHGAQGGERDHPHQHHHHPHHGFSRSSAPEPEEQPQEPEEAEAQDPTPTVSPVPSGGVVHHHHNNNNHRPMRIPAMYKHDEDENMGASARMERMVLLPPTRMDTPASNQMDNPSEEPQEQPQMPAEDNNAYYNFYEQQQQHPMMHHQLQPPQVYVPDGQEMPNGWSHHPHNMGHPPNNHWNQDNMGPPHPHPNNWNHPHNLLAHPQYSINNPMMMPPPNAAPMMIMNPHTMSPNDPRSNNQWPNPMLPHHQPNPFMASARPEDNNDAALGTSMRSMPNNNNSNGSSRRSSGGQMSNPYLEQDNTSLSQSLRSSSNHSGRLVAPNAVHAKPKKTSSDTTASSSRKKQQQKKKRRGSQQEREDHPTKDSPHKPERRPTNVLGYFPLGGQPKNHKKKEAPHKPDRRPTMATTLLSPLPVRQGSDSNSNRSRLRKLQDQNAQRLGRMHSSTGDIQKMQRFLQHNTNDHQEDTSNFSWFGNSSIGGGHNKNSSSKSNTVFDLNDKDGIPGSILVVSGVQDNDNNDPRRNDSTRAVRDNTSHNALLHNSTHAQKQTRRSSTLTEEEGSEEGMDQYHADGFHAEGGSGGCCHSHHHHHHHHPEPDTLLGNMPNNNNSNPTHLIQQTLQDAIANLGGMATVFPTGAQNRGSGLFGRNRPGGRNSLHKMEDSSYRSSGRQRLDDSKRTQSTLSSTFGGGSTIASEFTRMEIAIVQPPKPWQCVCGLEHDEEYRFCGFCGTSKYWTCASCRFDRNKCQFNHCGGCGVRRNINNGNGNKAGTGNNHHSNAMAA